MLARTAGDRVLLKPKEKMTMMMSTNHVRTAAAAMTLLLAAGGVPAAGKTIEKGDFGFANVADNANGAFTRFGSMPAINDAGAVAFNAFGPDFISGGVFKSEDGTLTTIASSA
jgi:hypothetical protein